MFKNMGITELCKELEPYEFDATTVSNHDCIFQGVIQALIRLLQAAALMPEEEPVVAIWAGMYLMVDKRVPKGKILVVSTVSDRCRDLQVISDLASHALEYGYALDFDGGRAGFIEIR